MANTCNNKEKNMKKCTCTYSCEKRGICCECVFYHRSIGEIPGCFFPTDAESTYDRSVEYFIKVMSKK
ncbi:MAG: hypothetical protein JW938_02725 [Candidatus Omnitrophica bacterium]|nr:hypothetical protein [Candidatus Omnitrophota bacterium]